MKRVLWIMGLLLISIVTLFSTDVSGDVDWQTWTKENSPYIVTGDIYGRLTIEAGVEVKFQKDTGYISNGKDLTISGLPGEENKVVLTGVEKTPGYWKGISFINPVYGELDMDYGVIEYARTGIDYATYTRISVTNSHIRYCQNDGIYTRHISDWGGQKADFEYNTISDNGGNGFYCVGYSQSQPSSFKFINNTVENNTQNGLLLSDVYVLLSGNHINNNGDAAVRTSAAISINPDSTPNYAAGNSRNAVVIDSNCEQWASTYDWIKYIWDGRIGLPFVFEEQIELARCTLTIEAGTELIFTPGSGLHLRTESGPLPKLICRGTEEKPVVFTGEDKTRGSWKGISLSPSSRLSLDYAVVEYGEYGIKYSHEYTIATPADISVTNSVIQNCRNDGIYVYHIKYNPEREFGGAVFDNNKIINNGGNGLNCISIDTYSYEARYSPAFLKFTNNIVEDNQKNGLLLNETKIILSGNEFNNNSDAAIRSTASFSFHSESSINSAEGNGYDAIVIDSDSVQWGRGRLNYHTWSNQGLPFFIDNQVHIRYSTVTIFPGTEIAFTPGSGLEVGILDNGNPHATLKVEGTAANPVRFTGRGESWSGLVFMNYATQDSFLEHCIIEDADTGITVDGMWLKVRDSLIRNCVNDGIAITGGGRIYLERSILRYNKNAGLHVINGDVGSFYDNVVEKNAAGILNESNQDVYALSTYWGDSSGPYHPVKNPGGLGNQVSDRVIFEPAAKTASGVAGQPREVIFLTDNTPYTGSVGQYKNAYFSFDAQAGRSLLVTLTPLSGSGAFSLTEEGSLATKSAVTPAGSYELLIRPTQERVYDFALFCKEAGSLGAGYRITASYLDALYISDISVKNSFNTGPITVEIEGVGFSDGMFMELSAGETTVGASEVISLTPTTAYAVFDITGVPGGSYSLRASNGIDPDAFLNGALTITAPEEPEGGHFYAKFQAPRFCRPGRSFSVTLEYGNDGDTPIIAPLITVKNNASSLMRTSSILSYQNSEFTVLGLGNTFPYSLLMPGSKVTRSFQVYVPEDTASHFVYEFEAEISTPDESSVAWDEVLSYYLSSGQLEGGTAVSIVDYSNLNIGSDWIALYNTIMKDIEYFTKYSLTKNSYLNGTGMVFSDFDNSASYDFGSVYGFEMAKSRGDFYPTSPTAAATDLAMASPGMPLLFSRSYYTSIPGRNTRGSFGRGWYHNYDYRLSVLENGNLEIKLPGDWAGRVFTGIGNNRYRASGHDKGRITLSGGNYFLTEQDGTVFVFDNEGKLVSIADNQANKITLHYSNTLDRISHSSGEFIDFLYDGNNNIYQAAGSNGQVVTYTYDPSGAHLISAEKATGFKLGYSYHANDGSLKSCALEQVILPGGETVEYIYDNQGRVKETGLAGDTNRVFYTYEDPVILKVTNSLGRTGTYYLGINGQVMRYVDPEGQVYKNVFDSAGNIVQTITPDEQIINMSYDGLGRQTGVMSPSGDLTRFIYDNFSRRLGELRDPRDSSLGFTYDSLGRTEEILFADGTTRKYTYDLDGNPDSFTNGRLDTIGYTYNSRGQIKEKKYPDGRKVTYDYNEFGQMYRAVDSETGEVAIIYNNRQLPEKITYPGGYFLQFEYDLNGRRISRTGSDGKVIKYGYNTKGLLSRIFDETDRDIVTYTYDEAGRLSEEKKGDGTRMVYQYNAKSEVFRVESFGPADELLTFSQYTYNDKGKCETLENPEGTVTYGYDLNGQLIEESYPGGRVITYSYDKGGNRISVTDNGTEESYVTNNMNQYESAGSYTMGYDDDGNLTAKTGPEGTFTYTYDMENRLIRAESPAGDVWTHTYDALGNRMGEDKNGEVKYFLNDPAGLGSIAAEFNGSGSLLTSYTHGLGLVSGTNSAGDEHYFHYDIQGNTTLLTAGDTVLNSYSYTAYGQTNTVNETIANPFRYTGRYGVREEGHGLFFMRARYYDAGLGRFTALDPIGLAGGDFNIYRYCGNDPVNFIDPSGLYVGGTYGGKIGGAIGGAIGVYIGGVVATLISERIAPGNNINTNGLVGLGGLIGTAIGAGIGAGIGQSLENIIWIQAVGIMGNTFAAGTASSVSITGAVIKGAAIVGGQVTAAAAVGAAFGTGINWAWGFVDKKRKTHTRGKVFDIILDAIDPGSFPGGHFYTPHGDHTENIRPNDPNEKQATPGVGEEHNITAGSTLDYIIYFENKPDADAPAQEVFVHDYLSEHLDWTTFELKEAGFGSVVEDRLAGKKSGRIYIPYNDILVELTVDFSTDTGYAVWTFATLDPLTGDYPDSPDAGFLPPEDGEGSGQGYVSFSIKAKADLAPGTVIYNKSSIIFDTNETIETNRVFNTIYLPDTIAPQAGTVSAGNVSPTGAVVNWTAGADDRTAQADLQYAVYYSAASNIGTIAECEANGTLAADYAAGVLTSTLNGLIDNTTYYLNVVVKDEAGNKTAYSMTSFTTPKLPDTTAPTAGVISFASVTETGAVVSWTGAVDNETSQANLQYAVYYSAGANIGTVAECEANGSLAADYTAGVLTSTLSGLTDNTTYYVNVVVRDEAGNKTAYSMTSFTTPKLPDTTAPTAGTLSFASVTESGAVVNWTNAVDNETSQANLQYAVYYSAASNIGTITECETNGSLVADYTAGVLTSTLNGLIDNTAYYVNVVVKDEAGNKTAYSMISFTTIGQSTPVNSFTLLPVDDTYVRSGSYAGRSFGTGDTLQVYKYYDLTEDQRYIYLKFDLASVKGHIKSARLFLYPTSVNGVECVLYDVTDDAWYERSVTYNTKPRRNLEAARWFIDEAEIEIDITHAVRKEWYTDRVMSMKIESLNHKVFASYHSKESAHTSLRPVLIIETEGAENPAPPKTLSEGNTVKLADLNGDGLLDLITGKAGGGTVPDRVVRYYLNDGTSEPFKAENARVLNSSPAFTYNLLTGDIDRDGRIDIIVAGGGRTQYYLNNGTADPFAGVNPSSRIDQGSAYAAAVADFNGDGYPDLVVENRIYYNNPHNPGFEGVTPFTLQDAGVGWTYGMAAGDVNGDGRPDLVFANMGGGGGSSRNNYYINNGTADPFNGVEPFYLEGPEARSDAAAIADMNGDGLADIIIGNTTEKPSVLYLNNGNRANPFEGVQQQIVTPNHYWTTAIKVADLDKDGDNDLITLNTAAMRWNVESPDLFYLNNGSRTAPFENVRGMCYSFAPFDKGKSMNALDVGDINNDGRLDIVTATRDYEVRIYLDVMPK